LESFLDFYLWSKLLKISIVTVCFNSATTILETLNSVASQQYKNFEHIIIDGGSSDGTLEIIKTWSKHKLIVRVGEDAGIYDAMNKGIQASTGQIVGILNSDDFYANANVLKLIVAEFESKKVDCVFSDLAYVDRYDTNKAAALWKSSRYDHGAFVDGWHPPHPTFFVRRDLYKKYGLFDLDFKISADFELMLRFLEKNKITSSYIPNVLVNMRVGGESGKSLSNIFIGNVNVLKAFKKNKIKINPLIYLFNRLAPKIISQIRSRLF
jgi:glycosyltransferase involved in cell wall biosynthesis